MARPSAPRVPDIIEFIKSDEYLGPDNLISVAQISILKAIYGLDMTPEERDTFEGISVAGKARKGGCSEAWIIAGRRSGKTDKIIANIAVYEGFFFNPEKLSPGETAFFPLVAQDTEGAMRARGYIEGKLLLLEDRGWEFLDHGDAQSRAITGKMVRCKREIDGRRYSLAYQCVPCTKASSRGMTAFGYATDESAFWRTDEGAYNPDVEVIRALSYTVATMGLRAKKVNATTPYGEEGVAWEVFEKARKGGVRGVVVNAPTWILNPNIEKEFLEERQENDPVAYLRECGAQFGKAGGSFLDPADLDKVISKDRPEIVPHQAGFQYAGALDVAHKHDLYVLAVGHLDNSSVPFDAIEFRQGTRKRPLDDTQIAEEYSAVLKSYGLDTVVGDQHFDLQIIKEYEVFGIKVIIEPQTDEENYEMYKNLKAVIRRGLTSLPDVPMIRKDLLSLRVVRMGQKGRPKIAAPDKAGFHDDISKAISVVLMKLLPLGVGPSVIEANDRAILPESFRKELAQARARRGETGEFDGDLMNATY